MKKDLHNKVFNQNDRLFNGVILELERIKDYITFFEPKDEQEEHLFYMIEKEAHALKESITILKDKRTKEHYNYFNK